ncbi:aryl-sulfate sulfotransferase, partial [bacterium]|nr:aryl-sulfate sulfotransferase [bacterium]
MNLMSKFKLSFLILFLAVFSCDKKADDIIEEVSLSPEIVAYEPDFIDENYLFLIENGGTSSYLINKQGDRLWTWDFDDNLGNDVELLENGQLLGIFKDDNRPFTLGGGSGIIKLFETNGSLKWQYTIADDNFLAHHDVEMLPNGNILVIVWERITVDQAQQAGIITNVD